MKKINLKGLITERSHGDENANEGDYLQDSDIVKTKLGKYTAYMDGMSGTVGWMSDEFDAEIFASPSWDGNHGWVPFDDNEGFHYGDLDFSKNPGKYKGNIKLQKAEYLKAVKAVIPKFEKRMKKLGLEK